MLAVSAPWHSADSILSILLTAGHRHWPCRGLYRCAHRPKFGVTR